MFIMVYPFFHMIFPATAIYFFQSPISLRCFGRPTKISPFSGQTMKKNHSISVSNLGNMSYKTCKTEEQYIVIT